MPQRPRDIGTAAESAVLRVLRTAFPSAERHPLHGSLDQGDIGGTPFCWEVKGGKAAENASDAQIEAWLGETLVETMNLSDVREGLALPFHDMGFLVTKRKAIGPANADRWWVHMWAEALAELLYDVSPGEMPKAIPVRMTLGDLIVLLQDRGYAERHDPSES